MQGLLAEIGATGVTGRNGRIKKKALMLKEVLEFIQDVNDGKARPTTPQEFYLNAIRVELLGRNTVVQLHTDIMNERLIREIELERE